MASAALLIKAVGRGWIAAACQSFRSMAESWWEALLESHNAGFANPKTAFRSTVIPILLLTAIVIANLGELFRGDEYLADRRRLGRSCRADIVQSRLNRRYYIFLVAQGG